MWIIVLLFIKLKNKKLYCSFNSLIFTYDAHTLLRSAVSDAVSTRTHVRFASDTDIAVSNKKKYLVGHGSDTAPVYTDAANHKKK